MPQSCLNPSPKGLRKRVSGTRNGPKTLSVEAPGDSASASSTWWSSMGSSLRRLLLQPIPNAGLTWPFKASNHLKSPHFAS